MIDTALNRTSAQGGDRGVDAGKIAKGRNRHIVADTLGRLLAVTETAACGQLHRQSWRWVVERTHAWNDRRSLVSTAWVWRAAARTLLNRLASSSDFVYTL